MSNTKKVKPKRLLSLLLTLTMVLGMIPVMGTTTALAYTGDGTESSPCLVTTYDELKSLMQNAPTDNIRYIRLGADIEFSENKDDCSLSLTSSRQNVVLDLFGHTLIRSGTTEDEAVINVTDGNLTIQDSNDGGKIVANMSGSDTKTALLVSGEGKLTVYGGTFDSNGRALVTRGGNTVVNGGTFLTSFYYYTAVFQSGVVTVNDGYFCEIDKGIAISIADADVTLNGCTLNGSLSVQTDIWDYIPDKRTALLDNEIAVTPQTYHGKDLKAENGKIEIIFTDGSEKYPYLVSNYIDLKAMMQYAPMDGSVCNIKLASDITFQSNEKNFSLMLISSAQNVVVDLNGHTLTRSGKTEDECIFGVAVGALTIKDSVGGGKVVGIKGDGNLLCNLYVGGNGKLTVDSGTFEAEEGFPLLTFGGTTVINGGTFVTESGKCAAANFINSTATLNGGTFRNNLSINTDEDRSGIWIHKNSNVTVYSCDTLGSIWTDSFDVIAPGISVLGTDKYGTTYSVSDAAALKEAYMLSIGRLISQVAITGIDTPKVGNKPDISATVNVTGADSAGVTWYDWTDKKTLTSSDKFKSGHGYMVMVTLNAKSGYIFSTTNSTLDVSINGNKGFLWLANPQRVQCCYNFETLRVPLTGTITLPNAYYDSTLNPTFSDNLQAMSEEGKLVYEWQIGDGSDSTWEVISGATERNYMPVKSDVGKYIRLVVTNEEGLEYIASNAVQVDKKQVNFKKPTTFKLLMSSDNSYIIVVGAKRYQEYLISYSSTAPASDSEQWNNAIRPNSSNSEQSSTILAMKMDCEPNQYVFVHTRIAETNDTVAGCYTETQSIYTGETSVIKGISLGYSSLDMKVGDVKLITATPIPSNADNWTGGEWYVNGKGAELYIDEACTTRYYRSIHGSKTELYLKATEKNNDITVGVEKTVGYNSVARGTMTVNVTDKNGNYKVKQMVFPEVNLHAGESVTVDISTYPNPSIIEGVQSIVYSNMPNDIVVTIYAKTKTARITANPGTPVGNYSCGVYVDGQQTSIPSFIKINVIDGEIPVESISVEPEAVSLAPGMSYKFSLTMNPANACVSDTVKWEYYSGSSKITVDSTGTVKVADDAVGGTSTVFKASYGGKSTTFKVTVAKPVENVRVDLTKPEAGELPSAPTLVITDGVDADSLTYEWYYTWGTYTKMDMSKERFEPGKTYRLCMEIDAADGYIFTNGSVANLGVAGGVDTCVVSNNTVTRLYFYQDFKIPGDSTGVTVSGTVTSYGSDTDDVIIQLIEQGQSEAAYEAVVSGNSANYSIGDVAQGTYTMKVIKKKHATREYTISVGGENLIQNAEICLLGDVNMDGNISVSDSTEVQMSAAKLVTLDDYQLKLADANRDGNVTIYDVTQIQLYLAHLINEF